MNFLLLFLIAILIGSIIVMAVSANKKKKEPPAQTCSNYIYNKACVENCGDKYVDEFKRECYDTIPDGKFAFDKKIVASCEDKYTYGQMCVLSCGNKYVDESKKSCYDTVPTGMFANGNKLVSSCDANNYVDGQLCVSSCADRPVNVIIEGKNCIKDCTKYLHNFMMQNNKLTGECKDICDFYYINDKFNRIGTNGKYCLSPSVVPSIRMDNLFIDNTGDKFILDYKNTESEKIFLQKSNVFNELLPVVLKDTATSFFRKLVVSPDGNTYGIMYNDHVDVYNGDIFNNDNLTPLRLINVPMEGASIENCIIYDALNLLLFLKKENENNVQYRFYHVRITNFEESLPQYFQVGEDFNKELGYLVRLYNSIEDKSHNIENEYRYIIGFVETIKDNQITTISPSVRTYIRNTLNDVVAPESDNDNQIYTINVTNNIAEEDVLDFKVSKNFGVVYTNVKNINNPPNKLKMSFRPFVSLTGGSQDEDNAINSYPIAVTNTNKAYYSKYNNDKSVSIYEASYDETDINNIPIYTIPDATSSATFATYETKPYVSLATNLEGTTLLCSLTEINAQNVATRKELHKIDLTLIPKTSQLLISS